MRRITIALASFFIAGAAAAQSTETYPAMNLRLAHSVPPTTAQSKIEAWWASEITKRSGGKIKIQILWAESGGKSTEIIELVGSGAIELGATPASYYPSELPLNGVTTSLPMKFRDNAEAARLQEGLIADVPAMREEQKKNGVWSLYWNSLGPYRVLCKTPIASLADLKGKRMRSYGAYVPHMWKALDAVGEVVLTNEVYESLDRGRLDCTYFSNQLIVDLKQYEVAKQLSTANFGALSTWPVWVNYDLWHKKWPESVKKLFSEVSAEAAAKSIDAIAKAEEDALSFLQKHGVQIVEFKEQNELNARVPDMRVFWLEQMKARGIGAAAQQVFDYWVAKEKSSTPK